MNASSGLGPIPATVLFAIGTGIVLLILGWVLSMTLGFRLSREKHTKLRFFLTIPFTNPLAAIVLLCKRPMLGFPGIVCHIIALMAIPVGGAIALRDEKAMMEELKRDLEEKEDPLVAEIPVSGPVPDEENLWMHPLFLPLFQGGAQDPALFGKRAIPQQPAFPAVEEILAASEMLRNGQGNPPRTWEEVAGPLLDFFEGSSNSLDRLEEALGREHAVLPFDPYHEHGDWRLEHLQTSLRNLSRSLHYRTQVQVLAGNDEEAFRLFHLNLRYARTDHPYLLITSLTQLARVTLALDTLKLAQQFHIGDEQQWRQVAEDLATLDLLPLLPRTMRMERKSLFVRHFPSSEIISGSEERTSNSGLFGALEFYFGDIVMATVHRSIRLALNQYGRWIEGAEAFVGKSSTTPWDECRPEAITGSGSLFRLVLAAPLDQAQNNFIKTQLLVEQARVAVALERYRLTHGAYPPSLDPLWPDFLSTDLLNPQTGAPWDYQRFEDGGFALFLGEGMALRAWDRTMLLSSVAQKFFFGEGSVWGAWDSSPPLPAPQGE